MSIASRITSIEQHIGDIYSVVDYIKDTTGINKNLINIPTYLIKGYLDILNNGTDNLYSNFPKVSGIGSNLSLTPTYEAPMKLNEIQGDTLQDGTPTPSSPVPIENVTGNQNIEVCGKNLFDKSTIIEGKYIDGNGVIQNDPNNFLGDFIEINNTKTYYISANTSSAKRIGYYNSNKEYISREVLGVRSSILTIPNNTKYVRLSCYNDNLDTLQLEQNSTATTYEAYKGNTYEVNLGKNMLDYSTLNYGYVNNIGTVTITHEQGEMYSEFIKVNPNTTYTFKIFETSSSYNNWIGIGEYTANNLSSFIQRITMTTATQNYYTFTTSATTQYIIVSARNLENATKVQLEKGQATSYSPYFTPIELNEIGDYQDSIKKSTGKNLLDISELTIGTFVYDNNGNRSNTNNYVSIEYIPVLPNTTYTYSADVSSSYSLIRIVSFTNTKSFISRSDASSFTNQTFTFTTSNNTYYVAILMYKISTDANVNDLSNPMLVYGSTALPYEPYGKVWYIENNIGKVVLDGSETWTLASEGFYISNTNWDNITNNNCLSKSVLYSNYYKNYTTQETLTAQNYGIGIIYGIKNLYIRNTDITTTSNFKTWLSTHNTIVNYQLITPTTTEITNTELINQLEELYTAKSQEGTTNISITSEDLEMILNVSVLKGE